MPVTFREAGDDEWYIFPDRALDERYIPHALNTTDKHGTPCTLWWLTDEDGHVTDVVLDDRQLMNNIHSK